FRSSTARLKPCPPGSYSKIGSWLDENPQEGAVIMDKTGKSRREFLKNIVVGAVVAKVGLLAVTEADAAETAGAKSTVVIAKDAQLYGANATPEASRVEKLLDRANRELDRVGYKLSNTGNGVRILGTDSKEAGYEETISEFGVVKTQLSKLLTRTCDCMINVPVLKDHEIAGVTLAMKNM